MPTRHPRGITRRMCSVCIASLITFTATPITPADESRVVERDDFAQRLRGMWLAECIANWTGLRTEGRRTEPPFLTDSDWGTKPPGISQTLTYVLDQDPWLSDDDTDIEYVYLDALTNADAGSGDGTLSPEQIADTWIAHINDFIWVSNRQARDLMDRGVLPPGTSLARANPFLWHIDAQLTTEFFGAMAPGMPDEALRMADPFVNVSASGYAGHASAFFVTLYSLAPMIDPDLSDRDQAIWLVQQCRRSIPDTSKSADVVDFVLTDFLANPDPDDWERTRDAIYDRYQLNATANGFTYRNWFESSVNFATGVMALLYGEMDLKRTMQIGTLSGWDSDNPTATVCGALGLALGEQGVRDAFAGEPGGDDLSQRYRILRTRPTMPDHLPADTDAQDSFTLMAERMLPLVDGAVRRAGGVVRQMGWALPPDATPDGLERWRRWPNHDVDARSATLAIIRAGGTIGSSASVGASAPDPSFGNNWTGSFRGGFETSDDGIETQHWQHRIYCSQGAAGATPGATQRFEVHYDRTVSVASIRFIEGEHGPLDANPPGGADEGGWFVPGTVDFEVRIGGVWQTPPGGWLWARAPSPSRPFEVLDALLDQPIQCDGVAIAGVGGGAGSFVTIAELDALAPPLDRTGPGLGRGFDLTGDGAVDIDDLYAWHATPTDLNADGTTDADDQELLESALRFDERWDMENGRR